jgi:hypothetical protein
VHIPKTTDSQIQAIKNTGISNLRLVSKNAINAIQRGVSTPDAFIKEMNGYFPRDLSEVPPFIDGRAKWLLTNRVSDDLECGLLAAKFGVNWEHKMEYRKNLPNCQSKFSVWVEYESA